MLDCTRPKIDQWHVFITGFLQDAGDVTGLSEIFGCVQALNGPTRRVEMRAWSDCFESLAKQIRRMSVENPRVCVYGYSWGGYSATLLARELWRWSIPVERLVLADAVYRHWYTLGRWRAFVPWSRISIPPNVSRVTWFRQQTDWPRGHQLVAESCQTTIDKPVLVRGAGHCQMDECPEFQRTVLEVAGL